MSTLTFCHSLGGQPGQILKEIVKEYNTTHDVQVQLNSIEPQNYASAAKEALTKPLEERPNLILAPEYMTGAMQQALKDKKVISASSLLDPDKLQDIAKIVKGTFGTDCLPFNPACGVLYINKTLLEKSGLDPNWKPSSFEDLVDACKKIKEKTKVEQGYTCAWPEAYLVEIVLAQKNRSLLDPEGNYHFSQLKNHILDLRHLVKTGVFLPPSTGNYDQTKESFIQGKVAFYMQGSGHASLIEKGTKEKGFELGYAPLPTLSKDQHIKYAPPLGGAAIWVFNPSDEKEQKHDLIQDVRHFLNYLASQKVQAKWHIGTAYVPVSQSVANSLTDFYTTHPLHEAVVSQTIEGLLGENSFGIKKENYHLVRPRLYPLVHELLYLEGTQEEVAHIIEEKLNTFDQECNQKN